MVKTTRKDLCYRVTFATIKFTTHRNLWALGIEDTKGKDGGFGMKRRLKPLLSTLLVLTMLLSLLPGGVMAASENAQMASAVMGTEGGANATPEAVSYTHLTLPTT